MRPARRCSALWVLAITRWQATGLLKHRLDQTGTAYDAAFYVLAALLFLRSYSRANTPSAAPAVEVAHARRAAGGRALHAVLRHSLPLRPASARLLTNLAGLSLVFLPLTFSWAIVRYRLMDTDLIFKRGVAYTLATGLMLGVYFGVIALIAVLVHHGLPQAVRSGAWASPSWPSP